MYQHKLLNLQKQMEELGQLVHPEYIKRVKKLDNQLKERRRLNEIYKEYMRECVERDYVLEKKAAQKEYDEKMMDLKDNLISDFEDRKRQIENERFSLELTNDSMEIKTTVTRKLRRRPNEPLPVIEKRRKPATGQLLVYQLDDKEIESDLKIIQRGKPLAPNAILQQNGIGSYGGGGGGSQQQQPMHGLLTEPPANSGYVETRIEDNKLLYERRWFCRGQQVYVEGKEMSKFAATITAIGNEVVSDPPSLFLSHGPLPTMIYYFPGLGEADERDQGQDQHVAFGKGEDLDKAAIAPPQGRAPPNTARPANSIKIHILTKLAISAKVVLD